jgi:hypothetical protein
MTTIDNSDDATTNTLSCYMRRGLPPRTSPGVGEFKPVLDSRELAHILSNGAYCDDALFDHVANYCLSGPELVEYLKYRKFFTFATREHYWLKTMLNVDNANKSTVLMETLLVDGRFPVVNYMGSACNMHGVQIEMLELLERHGISAHGIEIDPVAWRSHGSVVRSWLTAHGAVVPPLAISIPIASARAIPEPTSSLENLRLG